MTFVFRGFQARYYDSLSIQLLTLMADQRRGDGGLRERFEDVSTRIRVAAGRANRSPADIRLIAITKTQPASILKEALKIGALDFGENRVQEAEQKILEVGRLKARWHLVGHLQANKARRAIKLFDVIHSLDTPELAQRLDRLCVEEGRDPIPVLLQVDLGHEETKSGIVEDHLPKLLECLATCTNLNLIGLMTLPPFFENPEDARPIFRKLRELRDELAKQGHFVDGRGELSMGMTHDFEVAIEEGATMVRIGTAIFGERSIVAQNTQG
jgi:PLP dependent protein